MLALRLCFVCTPCVPVCPRVEATGSVSHHASHQDHPDSLLRAMWQESRQGHQVSIPGLCARCLPGCAANVRKGCKAQSSVPRGGGLGGGGVRTPLHTCCHPIAFPLVFVPRHPRVPQAYPAPSPSPRTFSAAHWHSRNVYHLRDSAEQLEAADAPNLVKDGYNPYASSGYRDYTMTL